MFKIVHLEYDNWKTVYMYLAVSSASAYEYVLPETSVANLTGNDGPA